jgi:hypothetical protein
MLSKTWQNIVIFPAILPANLNWIISDFFESSIYGRDFTARVQGMGIEQFRTSPRSPWQNCFVELIIGSIRRECLNHVIIINEGQLRVGRSLCGAQVMRTPWGYRTADGSPKIRQLQAKKECVW